MSMSNFACGLFVIKSHKVLIARKLLNLMIVGRSVADKVERVWSRCTGGDASLGAGVGVICWGCGVWHR